MAKFGVLLLIAMVSGWGCAEEGRQPATGASPREAPRLGSTPEERQQALRAFFKAEGVVPAELMSDLDTRSTGGCAAGTRGLSCDMAYATPNADVCRAAVVLYIWKFVEDNTLPAHGRMICEQHLVEFSAEMRDTTVACLKVTQTLKPELVESGRPKRWEFNDELCASR